MTQISDPTYTARPDVVVSGDGGGHFATDLATGETFELNDTARMVLDAAREGRSRAAIAADLAQRYPDVPRDEVASDVAEVLDDLVRRGLLAVA